VAAAETIKTMGLFMLDRNLAVGLDDHCRSLPTEIFYSILFYSILFCSILFYSILFYSILNKLSVHSI